MCPSRNSLLLFLQEPNFLIPKRKIPCEIFERRKSMVRSLQGPRGSSTETLTLNPEDTAPSSSGHPPQQTLVLRLKRAKKKVTWKEGTVDNEFLNRKSSKKCCIFHKEKPFDEDDSDEDSGCCRHDHASDHPKNDRAGPS